MPPGKARTAVVIIDTRRNTIDLQKQESLRRIGAWPIATSPAREKVLLGIIMQSRRCRHHPHARHLLQWLRLHYLAAAAAAGGAATVSFPSSCDCISLSFSFLTLHCHPHNTGKKLHKSNSGHSTSRKTISVDSWTCHSMKSERRDTPEVRTRRSTEGLLAV